MAQPPAVDEMVLRATIVSVPVALTSHSPILLEVYPNAPREVVVRAPSDYGVARIGHEGAFRRGMEPLWDEMFDWLTNGVTTR